MNIRKECSIPVIDHGYLIFDIVGTIEQGSDDRRGDEMTVTKRL